MTMRKPNYAQQIQELKNEIDTVEKFMQPAIKKTEELRRIESQRPLTEEEVEKGKEYAKYVREKNAWLMKAKTQLDSFYKPVCA